MCDAVFLSNGRRNRLVMRSWQELYCMHYMCMNCKSAKEKERIRFLVNFLINCIHGVELCFFQLAFRLKYPLHTGVKKKIEVNWITILHVCETKTAIAGLPERTHTHTHTNLICDHPTYDLQRNVVVWLSYTGKERKRNAKTSNLIISPFALFYSRIHGNLPSISW